jgi:glycosyltransferase involved in cell wall biosynthesis
MARPGRTTTLAGVRVLVVSNLYPDRDAPARGVFVRDQVERLRQAGVEVELFTFPPGMRRYGPATLRLRRLLRSRSFDLVHAHYGLAGWCAALARARPLVVTFHGTDVRHRVVGPLSRRLARHVDLVAAVSAAMFRVERSRPGLPRPPGAAAVLPCGAELDRFSPRPRAEARSRLDLDPQRPYLLFAADPRRRVKRYDRAQELAGLTGAELLVASGLDPGAMPDWMNAANAVVVPSDNEGFGMVAVEALACEVPVLSTPVGVAPALLAAMPGCLAAPFDASAWAAALRPHVDSLDPRVPGGAERSARFSSVRMAERVCTVYRELSSPSVGDDAALRKVTDSTWRVESAEP